MDILKTANVQLLQTLFVNKMSALYHFPIQPISLEIYCVHNPCNKNFLSIEKGNSGNRCSC